MRRMVVEVRACVIIVSEEGCADEGEEVAEVPLQP